MNHTVVVDEEYRARQFENRLNAVARHCRIGKVTHKGKRWNGFGPLAPIVAAPLPHDCGVYNPSPDWFTRMAVPHNSPPFISSFTTARVEAD